MSTTIPNRSTPPGPSIPRYGIGHAVQSAKSGDQGVIYRVIPQRYADDLYVVVWHDDSNDTDMYSASSLRPAGAKRS